MGQSLDLVKGLYEAFGRGDVPAVLAAFDPSIEWNEAESFKYSDRNPHRGPQGVLEGVFMRIVSEVENFTVVPLRHVDGGDAVVTEGRYQGTVRSSGAKVDCQFAHVWRIRDGKIAGFQQYTDTRQWAAAGL